MGLTSSDGVTVGCKLPADLTEAADLVIGTSSGATTAAQVRSGIPAAGLLASVLSPPGQPAGQHAGHNQERPPSLPMATVFERMRAIGAAATSAADLRRAMGAFGLESDPVFGPPRRARAARHGPHAQQQRQSLHQRWRALRGQRRPCLGPCRPAQAGQPRRGDHTGRRFPGRNEHKPDGPGDPHPRRHELQSGQCLADRWKPSRRHCDLDVLVLPRNLTAVQVERPPARHAPGNPDSREPPRQFPGHPWLPARVRQWLAAWRQLGPFRHGAIMSFLTPAGGRLRGWFSSGRSRPGRARPASGWRQRRAGVSPTWMTSPGRTTPSWAGP
jgi:hypothetical protein